MAAVVAPPRPVQRETFGLAGRTLGIDVDDQAVAHILQTTYSCARVQNTRTVNHVASMRRLGDGRLHVRFDRRAVSVGEPAQPFPLLSAYYATKEVFARFAAAHPGCIAFYGALVAVNGAAVLILGPTTIGKTLFALHLASQGATFLGDETAVLDLRSGSICALARKPALREPALSLLPSDEMRARVAQANQVLDTDRGRFWYALGPQELCGVVPSDRSYRLAAVCVIRERAQTFALKHVDFEQALPAIMQRAYARPSQLTELSGLRRSMRRVTLHEIALADPQASAAAFLQEAGTCA
jgi:hypothetical protein